MIYRQNDQLDEAQEHNDNRKVPRPVILVTPGLTSYSIVTPKSMTLVSDGIQEDTDYTLAGNLWTIPSTEETIEFLVGSFRISYKLPPILIKKELEDVERNI